ncbi:MAG TPA: 50S ribosomal protein L6 [Firmicutes bacterium]|nr:50S ribosomal protein L6 [Bacillota bacterium]
MSRIGRKPIDVPSGVDVKINGNHIAVKGPKGTLERDFHHDMAVALEGNVLTVSRPSESKEHKSLHGLTRTLIANMVAGVSTGFSKELEINGVGYRAAKQGKNLVMNLGYSHQVIVSEIPGITIDVPAPNKIVISGPDKQAVGQFAAEVREKRPPEPYKGKGIKYIDEYIIRKEGKAGKGSKK